MDPQSQSETDINIILFNKTLKRNTFIFFILIWPIIYILSIFIIIPPIIALVLYIQDNRSLKHSFHKLNAYWLIIWTALFNLSMLCYIIYYLVIIIYSIFIGFGIVTILLHFLLWCVCALLLFINFWYLKMLMVFKDLVVKEQGEGEVVVEDKVEENLDDGTNQA